MFYCMFYFTCDRSLTSTSARRRPRVAHNIMHVRADSFLLKRYRWQVLEQYDHTY